MRFLKGEGRAFWVENEEWFVLIYKTDCWIYIVVNIEDIEK